MKLAKNEKKNEKEESANGMKEKKEKTTITYARWLRIDFGFCFVCFAHSFELHFTKHCQNDENNAAPRIGQHCSVAFDGEEERFKL